jgi:hypothetical protein
MKKPKSNKNKLPAVPDFNGQNILHSWHKIDEKVNLYQCNRKKTTFQVGITKIWILQEVTLER